MDILPVIHASLVCGRVAHTRTPCMYTVSRNALADNGTKDHRQDKATAGVILGDKYAYFKCLQCWRPFSSDDGASSSRCCGHPSEAWKHTNDGLRQKPKDHNTEEPNTVHVDARTPKGAQSTSCSYDKLGHCRNPH